MFGRKRKLERRTERCETGKSDDDDNDTKNTAKELSSIKSFDLVFYMKKEWKKVLNMSSGLQAAKLGKILSDYISNYFGINK